LKNVFRQPSPVKVQNTQDTAILLFHRYVMQRNLKGFPLYWRATSGTQSPWFNFAFFVLGIQMLIMGSPNAGKRLRRVSSFDPSAGQRPALYKRHNKITNKITLFMTILLRHWCLKATSRNVARASKHA